MKEEDVKRRNRGIKRKKKRRKRNRKGRRRVEGRGEGGRGCERGGGGVGEVGGGCQMEVMILSLASFVRSFWPANVHRLIRGGERRLLPTSPASNASTTTPIDHALFTSSVHRLHMPPPIHSIHSIPSPIYFHLSVSQQFSTWLAILPLHTSRSAR